MNIYKKKEYKKWVRKFGQSERGKEALDALEELKRIVPQRDKKSFLKLTEKVKRICFFASHYHREILREPSISAKETIRDLKEEIPSKIKGIEKLGKFLNKYPGIATEIFSETSPGVDNISKDFGDIPVTEIADLFKALLEIFGKGLKQHSKKIKDYPAWRRRYGALIYPGPLAPQTQVQHPEINSLLFALTHLFRNYTIPYLYDDTLLDGYGPMPGGGKPCYGITAKIANAVFFPEGDQSLEDNEFDENKIRYRIRCLTDQRVILSLPSWMTGHLD